MELERYPELEVLSQFFEGDDQIELQEYKGEISSEFEVLYVYGISPYVDTAIEWLNQDSKRELIFLEDRMEALKKIKGGILNHSQVHLKFYLGYNPLEEFITEVITGFPYEKIGFISLHPNRERFEEIKNLLYRKVTLESAIHLEMMYAHKLAKNLFRNFKRLPDAFNVGLWKDQFKDVPAVICGAGPSLEDVTEELKGIKGKALVMAGGSAITALSAKGITPDLLFAIDPNPEEFTRLAFHTAYDVPLIFGCRLEPNVFYSHAGPIGYLMTGTGGLLEKWMEERLGIKDYEILKGLGEEALSVTAIAFMTAIYLGCNPIILAGVDLSYHFGKRYAKGVMSDLHLTLEESPAKAGDMVWDEAEVTTITKWKMERDVLDDVARQYPSKTFIKASSKGLPFKNILHDPNWSKNCKTECRQGIEKLVGETALGVKDEEVRCSTDLFFESMRRSKKIVSDLVRCKNVILEMDLEEEIAYQIALKPAVYALSFHLRKDCKESEAEREVYKRLQPIIDHYLENVIS
jgi:hypothetical protein